MRHINLGENLYFKFTTRRFTTGAPFTLAGSPVISAYRDDSVGEITAGITLSVDFDGRTGLNHVTAVLTGGNGFSVGYYAFTITVGTVDGVSVVGEIVHEIVIGPAPSHTVSMANDVVTAAAIADNAIDAAALASDCITASKIADNAIDANAIAAGAITSAKFATDAITSTVLAASAVTEIQTGLASQTDVTAIKAKTDLLPTDPADQSLLMAAIAGVTAPSAADVADAVWDEILSGHVVAGSTGEALAAAGSAADPWLTALPGSYAPGTAGQIVGQQIPFINAKTSLIPIDPVGITDIAPAVWDALLADYVLVGSMGEAMSDAAAGGGGGGDPWLTPLPGAYPLGSAGRIIGDNIDATVASRATQGSVDVVNSGVTAIGAKTVNLPSDPADASDVALAFANVPNSVWSHVTRTLTAGAPPTPADITNAVWAFVVEAGITAQQSLRLANAANGGRTDGFVNGVPTTGHVRDANNTKNRVTAAVDGQGNRNSVVLDLT
jgi:hypothetical protein